MKIGSKIPLLLAGCLVLLGLCGCQSNEYYHDQAVQKARSYLLEELEDMPFMDQEYIKFNRPFLLVEQISSGYRTGMVQVCICWMTPGNPDVYMVYGVSGVRMIDWSPQRIIRRNFNNPNKDYVKIAATAADDLLKALYPMLDAAAVNHIRFTMPGVWKCNIPLDSNPGSTLDETELKRAEELPRYVLAWQITQGGQQAWAYYGGTAKNDQLEGFKNYFSGVCSDAEFRSSMTSADPVIAPFGAREQK